MRNYRKVCLVCECVTKNSPEISTARVSSPLSRRLQYRLLQYIILPLSSWGCFFDCIIHDLLCVWDTPGLSCVYRFSFQFVLIFFIGAIPLCYTKQLKGYTVHSENNKYLINLIEITNKMRPCSRIYYSNVS